jgi:hypothetical protein
MNRAAGVHRVAKDGLAGEGLQALSTKGGGRPEDAQLMLDLCDNIEGKSFCPLGDAASWAHPGPPSSGSPKILGGGCSVKWRSLCVTSAFSAPPAGTAFRTKCLPQRRQRTQRNAKVEFGLLKDKDTDVGRTSTKSQLTDSCLKFPKARVSSNVCREKGYDIPSFCYYADLGVAGVVSHCASWRIEKCRSYRTSCTSPAPTA